MLAVLLLRAFLCGGSAIATHDESPTDIATIPSHPQRAGDAAAGYEALISGSWVGCGIPADYYDLLEWLVPDNRRPETLAGRREGDETLPFFLNRFRTKDGIDVLAPNCLYCHAGRIEGELVVGLGNADGRYQIFGPEAVSIARWVQRLSWLYFWSPARRREMQKVGERMAAVAPYIAVEVAGLNPTHNLAWSLIMHRDRRSLQWLGTPEIEAAPILGPPSDVPPWWRMAKKHALFAAAGGRGDHTGFTAVNSALCVDSVDQFLELYEYFDDIHAYLSSIEPPRYPHPIDAALRRQGQRLFDDRCAGCHGTYDEDPAKETYPNRIVPIEKIGTDPELAVYNVITSRPASEWLNESVFTRFGEYRPELGYVAPPLDGIWATAPFLHNGSVPTLRALLRSSSRPEFWTWSRDSRDFDSTAVGWIYEERPTGRQAALNGDATATEVVDTTLYGMSNQGHTYGDDLSDRELEAVLEYLKSI